MAWFGLTIAWLGFGAGAVQAGNLALGNLVFRDANANRRYDIGSDQGMAGVRVQLFPAGADVLQDAALAEMLTGSDGTFLFEGLDAGQYQVFIPPVEFQSGGPLHGMLSLPDILGDGVDDDAGEDGYDDMSPEENGILSTVATLLDGSAPMGNGVETGYLSELDDAVDGDVDLTLDLGFYRPVGVGNLVFADMNENGHADADEGVPGVHVKLYRAGSGELPLSLVAETVTDSAGRYVFLDLIEGDYVLEIPASEFAPGRVLSTAVPLAAETPLGDDDTGGDITGMSLGGDARTAIFNLTAGAEPTAATFETGLEAGMDDLPPAVEANIDLTRDFGFIFPTGRMGVGNLVFVDRDGDGVADPGEGMDDVVVRLFAQNANPQVDAPLAQRRTEGGGYFLFENLLPGSYFIHIPAEEFRLDRPLYGALSLTSASTEGDDDVGENGLQEAAPDVQGVRTADFDLVLLEAATATSGEVGLGADSDDFRDDLVDLTHDLGFSVAQFDPVGIGNAVFKDRNGNNRMEAAEGVEGVTVRLFAAGRDPQTSQPLGVRMTDPDGLFLFEGLVPGGYFLHIPAYEFGPAMPLQLTTSLAGYGLDNGQDDSVDENGEDAVDPAATGVRTRVIQLTPNLEPTDANSENGFAAANDNGDDNNIDLTVDFGFSGGCAALGISPLVNTFKAGRVGEVYSQQLSVSGGTAPYTWTWRAGTLAGLPQALTLDNTGLVSGTPVNSADHTIILRVTDAQGCFTELTRTFSIAGALSPLKVGNVVFSDSNLNNRHDTGEGVDGVTVQLFAATADPLVDIAVAQQETAGGGRFLFSAVPAGSYFLFIPAQEFQQSGQLLARVSLPGQGGALSLLDDDADENGEDAPIPKNTGVRSSLFTLTPGGAPSGETGVDAASDDADDANVDLTRDFGFRPACHGLTLAALPDGGYLKAYSQQLVASGGAAPYVFNAVGSLPPGLLMNTSGLISGTPTSAGSFSFEVDVTGVDECVKRVPVTLVVNPGLGVGNLIYLDDNEDDTFDAGEGIAGVVVRLFPEGADAQTAVPLATRSSGTGGFYLFEGLTAGRYFLHVPKEEFAPGRPLNGKMSIRGAGADNGLDDQIDENGLDALDPTLTGVSTAVFELSAGLEPTDESQAGTQFGEFGQGATQDATVDANFDLTMDLGFTRNCPLITLTPPTLPSIMAGDPIDQSFFASGGTLPYTWTTTLNLPEGLALSPAGRLTGTLRLPGNYELRLRATDFYGCKADITVMQGVTVEVPLSVGNLIFIDQNRNGRADEGEGVPNVTVQLFQQGMNPLVAQPVVAPVTTNAQGRYLFAELGEGTFFVHVPTSQFLEGGPLYQHISIPGAGTDNGQDDDVGENGVDTALPASFGISSTVFTLTVDTEPTNAATETGLGADDDLGMDNDGDMTIDLGFVPLPAQGLTVGNLVYVDADGDTRPDPGEGKDGVTVQVFRLGDNPLFVGPLQSQVTSGGGFYRFTGLEPGNYFVHVPPANFQPGGVLFSHVSVAGFGLDTGADDNVDENGVDAPTPSSTGVSSMFFSLAYYLEPRDSTTETGTGAANDNTDDANGDMTIDFGFRVVCGSITVGTGGTAISAMQTLDFTRTFTASGGTGAYAFSAVGALPAGLTLSTEGLLSGKPTVPGTVSFQVRATDALGCNATSASISFTTQAAPPGTTLGNLVFIDHNGNGRADAGEGIDGVTVRLMNGTTQVASTVSTGGGMYAFADVAPGTYSLHVPAAMFANGAPLAGMKSLPGSTPGSDDDLGEDGQDVVSAPASGVGSVEFVLDIGTAPVGETGTDAGSDDARDAFTDLTWDFGFTNILPYTYVQWITEYSLEGESAPQGDPDADDLVNGIEFALAQSPVSSLQSGRAFKARLKHNAATGKFDFEFQRRLGGVQGATYKLGLGIVETDAITLSTLVPTVTPTGDGLETVTYADVGSDAFMAGQMQGLVWLQIELNLDEDPELEFSGTTEAWCWRRHNVAAGGSRSFTMPLLRPEVCRSFITAVSGGTITPHSVGLTDGGLAASLVPGLDYYVELISGPNVGHRWEVNEAATTADSISLDLTSVLSTRGTAPAIGEVVSLRPHQTLDSVFGTQTLQAGSRQSQADRVLFFDRAGNRYLEHWLALRSGGLRRWQLAGDQDQADRSGRILSPGEGVFVNPRSTTVTLPLVGLRRQTGLVVALGAGTNFVGTGSLLAAAPAQLFMSTAYGFTGSTRTAQADRLRVWNNAPGAPAPFTGYYLYRSGAGVVKWVREGDADLGDLSSTELLPSFEGFFLIHQPSSLLWFQSGPILNL